MKMTNIDLSTKENSMTARLIEAKDKLNKIKSKDVLISTVENIFKENHIDTKASRRLISNMKKSPNNTMALFTLYNSILKGSNLGVV